jgi:hypothetical protein
MSIDRNVLRDWHHAPMRWWVSTSSLVWRSCCRACPIGEGTAGDDKCGSAVIAMTYFLQGKASRR